MSFRRWAPIVFPVMLYLVALGNVPLQLPDESREAEISREIWVGGPLQAPRLNGDYHVVKPPLTYWAAAATFAAAGEPIPRESVVRLASALFTLATIGAVFLLGRALFSSRHGALAALILATSPTVLSHGRRIITDNGLVLFTTVAIGCALLAVRSEGRRRLVALSLGAGVALALGFLAKGPVAVILSGLAIAGALALAGGPRAVVQPRALAVAAACTVALAPAVALWIWILWRDGGRPLVDYYVGYHTGGLTGVTKTHVKALWFYVLHGPDGFLPWLLFLPFAAFARSAAQLAAEPRSTVRALAGWVVLPLAFFCVMAQKREIYLLPLYPPLALVAAYAILEAPATGTAGRIAGILWRVLQGALAVAAVGGPIGAAIWARQQGEPATAIGVGIALAVAAVAVIALGLRDPEEREAPLRAPFATASLAAIVALALIMIVEPHARGHRSLRPLARGVAAELAREPGVTVYGYVLDEALSGALPYELGRTFPALRSLDELLEKLAAEPGARVLTVPLAYEAAGKPGRVAAELDGEKRTVLIIRP